MEVCLQHTRSPKISSSACRGGVTNITNTTQNISLSIVTTTGTMWGVVPFLFSLALLHPLRIFIASRNPGRIRSGGDGGVRTEHCPASFGRGVNWDTPRGGSTMEMMPSEQIDQMQQHQYEEPFQPPKIDLEHMSLALRVTSEWNRRLIEGVSKRLTRWKPDEWDAATDGISSNHQQALQQRGGSYPVNVHPSRSWHPPISEGSEKDEQDSDLTLFHAKSPREQRKNKNIRRGVARYGPELLPFLEHIVDLLGLNDKSYSDGVEIPLAMIYLDRACSVETPRSSGVPSCPFCTPRTVHRLSLVALLVAAQAVHGGMIEEYYDKLQSLGIPLSQLEEMVDWMKGALGDPGLLVTVGQMKQWSQTWASIFNPRRSNQALPGQQPQDLLFSP